MAKKIYKEFSDWLNDEPEFAEGDECNVKVINGMRGAWVAQQTTIDYQNDLIESQTKTIQEMSSNKIPKSFKFLSYNIKIKYVDDLNYQEGNIGQARYRTEEIALQKSTESQPLSEARMRRTFLHEKFHWLLKSAGEYDQAGNEKLIDLLSQLWHQSELTEEF